MFKVQVVFEQLEGALQVRAVQGSDRAAVEAHLEAEDELILDFFACFGQLNAFETL